MAGYTLVEQQIVSGAAVSTVTFDHTLKPAYAYMLRWRLMSDGTSFDLRINPNGIAGPDATRVSQRQTTTVANYLIMSWTAADHDQTEGTCIFSTAIEKAGANSNRSGYGFCGSQGPVDANRACYFHWANTSTEWTSLQIQSAVNFKIEAGSVFDLYEYEPDSVAGSVTTEDALSSEGAHFAWTLLIEGYDKIITSWSDTDAVVAAYAATEWGTAVSGLQVPGEITERIELFGGKLDSPSIRLVVNPVEADTVGIDLSKTADSSGYAGKCASTVDSDDTTIDMGDISDWPSSGTAYIGTEHIGYASKSGISLTSCRRGKYAPFKADTETEQRFGQYHARAKLLGNTVYNTITSYPRVWIGRKVRLLLHTVTGTTLNSFANAYTVFAGTLDGISDSESGATVLDVVHINDYLSKAILLPDQYSAVVKPGIYLRDGETIYFEERTSEYGGQNGWTSSVQLKIFVLPGGGSGVTLAQGWYELDEIISAINDKLSTKPWKGYSVRLQYGAGGLLELVGSGYDDLDPVATLPGVSDKATVELKLEFSHTATATFLGFTGSKKYSDREYDLSAPEDIIVQVKADETPRRTAPIQQVIAGTGARLLVEEPSGTWVNTSGYKELTTFRYFGGSDDWGIISIDGTLAIAIHTSDTQFDSVQRINGLTAQALGLDSKPLPDLSSSGNVEVKQVIALRGGLAGLLLRIFASTGTAGYNHSVYDVLPTQLGLAIPWEMLGTRFYNTARALKEAYDLQSMTVVLDRPTRFLDILAPELLIRNAFLQLHGDGELYFALPHTPSRDPIEGGLPALTYSATLSSSDKAGEASNVDPQRTSATRSSEHLVNKITVKYNRTIDDDYLDERTIVNIASQTDHGGQSYPITIKLRNAIAGNQPGEVENVENAICDLSALVLGQFSHELTAIRRTIDRTRFWLKPGMTVGITDGFVRDPTTGVRGITAFPAWILSVSRDWSTGIGQVECVLLTMDARDRFEHHAPVGGMSPGGYDTGTGIIDMNPGDFGITDEDGQDPSHFAVGDFITVIEASPADPSSPDTWSDEIQSISGTLITTVNNNGNGVYDSNKSYIIVPDTYDNVISAQKQFTFLADDDSHLVDDDKIANFWLHSSMPPGDIAAADTTVLHKYHPTMLSAANAPLTAYQVTAAATTLNSLLARKLVSSMPEVCGTEAAAGKWEYRYTSADSDVWQTIQVRPIYLGRGAPLAGGEWERYIYVAPSCYRQSGSGEYSVRVTCSSKMPTGSSFSDVTFSGLYAQASWTALTNSTLAIQSQLPLGIAVDDMSGVGYLIVEIKAVSGEVVSLVGIGECWQGPPEEA